MSYRPFLMFSAGIAALGIGPAAHAQAQSAAGKPIARAELVGQISTSYKAVDANNDGGITAAEIDAAHARAVQAATAEFGKRRDAAFRTLDTNKDGQLSAAEFNAGSPVPQAKPSNSAQLLGQMDSNKDQKVSTAEFGARALANFDRADLNKDGTVSVDEQQKARATR